MTKYSKVLASTYENNDENFVRKQTYWYNYKKLKWS